MTMRDIRPIREHEATAFLRLLCDVFSLDYYRAENIFFNEPMFSLDRKWALFEGTEMLSILTTVPLEFGWGKAIGIAGVATVPERRGEGLAAMLLERALKASAKNGEKSAFLFARDPRLYERLGFQVIDAVIRSKVLDSLDDHRSRILTFEEVQRIYDDWASRSPDRLRRDERRWRYWRWNLRVCTAASDGYVCVEGGTIRECVANTVPDQWGVGGDAEWFGLSSMAKSCNLNLTDLRQELLFMGRNTPGCPQMFLTDQF